MQNEFIEFVRHDTGQEFNDFRDWKLGLCLDLIERFVEKKQDDFLKSITLKKKEDEIFLLPVIDSETLTPKQ